MSQDANATMHSSIASGSATSLPKRNSEDVGWEYGFVINENNKDRVQCKLCGKQMGGGVSRLKKHIAHIRGDVSQCLKSSKEDQDKCKEAIMEAKTKRLQKQKEEKELRDGVDIDEREQIEEDLEIVGSKKRPHFLGPMNKFTSTINPKIPDPIKMKQRVLMTHFSRKELIPCINMWLDGCMRVVFHFMPWTMIALRNFVRRLVNLARGTNLQANIY
ncbi:hypothetical protein Dimus_039212 [Dionaea muscipula]